MSLSNDSQTCRPLGQSSAACGASEQPACVCVRLCVHRRSSLHILDIASIGTRPTVKFFLCVIPCGNLTFSEYFPRVPYTRSVHKGAKKSEKDEDRDEMAVTAVAIHHLHPDLYVSIKIGRFV